MDLDWLIHFDDNYMQLLTEKYHIPFDKLIIKYYKKIGMEVTLDNPHQYRQSASEYVHHFNVGGLITLFLERKFGEGRPCFLIEAQQNELKERILYSSPKGHCLGTAVS